MRMTFDQTVPYDEQSRRVALSKQPGRKHLKKGGAKVAQKMRNTARRRSALSSAQSRKFHETVRAYYLGQLDDYPKSQRHK